MDGGEQTRVSTLPVPGRSRGGWDTVQSGGGRAPALQEPPDTEEGQAAAAGWGRDRRAGSLRGGNTEAAAGSRSRQEAE